MAGRKPGWELRSTPTTCHAESNWQYRPLSRRGFMCARCNRYASAPSGASSRCRLASPSASSSGAPLTCLTCTRHPPPQTTTSSATTSCTTTSFATTPPSSHRPPSPPARWSDHPTVEPPSPPRIREVGLVLSARLLRLGSPTAGQRLRARCGTPCRISGPAAAPSASGTCAFFRSSGDRDRLEFAGTTPPGAAATGWRPCRCHRMRADQRLRTRPSQCQWRRVASPFRDSGRPHSANVSHVSGNCGRVDLAWPRAAIPHVIR
jgi:hypothetical protein